MFVNLFNSQIMTAYTRAFTNARKKLKIILSNDSLNSNHFLASTYIDYNLLKSLSLYTEGGTNGSDFAYGSGFALSANVNGPGFNGGVQLYFPLITEEGMVDSDNYADVLRFNIYFNLGGLF